MLKTCSNVFQIHQSHSFFVIHAFRQQLMLPCSTSSSSSSISPENTTSTSTFTNYLADSLGFSPQQCVSISSKYRPAQLQQQVTNFNPTNIKKADSIVSFLKHIGMTHSQIQKSISSDPRILFCKVDKTLKPKIQYLQNLGVSQPELARIASLHPFILYRNLDPVVQAFRAVLGPGSDHIFLSIFKKLMPYQLCAAPHFLICNVELLGSYGIPIHRIRKYFVQKPSPFLVSNSAMQAVLTKVEHEWGIPLTSGMFLPAVLVRACLSDDTITAKCQMFRRFGWTQSDVSAIIQRNPAILCNSEARIEIKLKFLMNELGSNPAYLASHSILFNFSLEKRTLPRHRVLQLLRAKELIKRDYKLYGATCVTESKFLAKFIHPFMEVMPNLLDVYNGIGVSCGDPATLESVRKLNAKMKVNY